MDAVSGLESLILERCAAQLAAAADAEGRRVIYLPGARTRAMSSVSLAAELRSLHNNSADDPLLAVGACGKAFTLHGFASLARSSGWEHCQYWTDGQARFAIHVLERSAAPPLPM